MLESTVQIKTNDFSTLHRRDLFVRDNHRHQASHRNYLSNTTDEELFLSQHMSPTVENLSETIIDPQSS